ncbi:MAG: hypothetical protein CMQ20_07965 [Gammaproteobacteria bacterium]|jgi:hypothetical protein|nr:hypothetical protein [Gammaproteobacteria bacterium]|tara:strand:- start:195 stop:626 length:432 start_codon:yes stop_codon:yes gene_type:complete
MSENSRFFSLLFPKEPRTFPYRRVCMMTMRVAHILTSGVLFGGLVFDQAPASLMPWLWGAVLSGTIILAIDMHASCAILCEVRGVAIAIKMTLLMLVNVFWEQGILLLTIIMIVGVFSSHMSRKYRHRLIFFSDRIVTDERRG